MKTKLRLKSGLALLLTLVMLFSVMTPMMSFTATALTVDTDKIGENTKLTSKTDYAVAPGITETHIITHNTDGSNQVQAYALEIDLSNPNVGILTSHKNYMGNLAASPSWGFQTVRDQAIAAENYYQQFDKNFDVVGGINGDYFNMQVGNPLGSFVMNGNIYSVNDSWNYFAILNDGTPVIGSGAIPEGTKELIGGPSILIKDGQIVADPNNTDLFPRTSVGIKADGTVIFITADGRQAPYSVGQTIYENAQQMLSLGCVAALQLDGGGSATIVSQREGEESLSVRNSPSDGAERTVSTALLVYSTAAPDGVFDHANLSPNNELYTPGSTVTFTATGVDGAGSAVELPAEGTFALADAAAGTIDPATGVYTAAEGYIGDVTVNYIVGEAVKGSTTVSIVAPDALYVSSTEQAVGPGITTDFGIVAKYQDRDVNMKDDDIIWTIVDQSTGADLNGIAGTFSGLTFTSAEENAYNAKVTATLACNTELVLDLTVFIGSKQVTLYDFEYVTGEENKDAENYIPSFSIPTYSATWLSNNSNGGYGSRAEHTASLYEAGWPIYTWPNGSITDPNNESAVSTVVSAEDGEPTRFGDKSLKIHFDYSTYNFQKNANFYIRVTEPTYAFEGSPTAIGCWVYAPEGTTNYILYLNCANRAGSVNGASYQPLGNIDWVGWKYLEFDLTGTKTDEEGNSLGGQYVGGSFEPFGFYQDCGVFWISYQPASMGHASEDTIYIDDITLIYGANTSDTINPEISYIGGLTDELIDGETVYTSNVNTLKAQYADVEDKYMTGIDDAATKMYIDGVDVTDKCYINEGDDEIYFYDAYLANGTHCIEIEVADVFGNKTIETRYFTVKGEDSNTEFNLVEIDGAPVLGEKYSMAVVTNNLDDVQAAEIEVKALSNYTRYWNNFEIVAADGFEIEGEPVFNETLSTINFTVKKSEAAPAAESLDNAIVYINVNVPTDVPEGLEATYRISKGSVTYASEKAEKYVTGFSGKITTTCISPFTVNIDTMIVGSAGGYMTVTDTDGNVVEGVNIYYGDTVIGTTDANGQIFTDAFVQSILTFTVYAEKEGQLSFEYTTQSFNAGGDATGIPTNVKLNASQDSATSQNISWMASPLAASDSAIVKYATKADYEANGDAAFVEFAGISNVDEINASGNVNTNYAVRFNSAVITGLTPDTDYVYMVGDGTNWSPVKNFSTTRSGVATNFFVMGDTQSADTTNVSAIFNQLATSEKDFGFGIQTGDAVDNAGDYNYWSGIGNVFSGEFIDEVDMIHVLGNHEYTGDAAGIHAAHYFNLPGTTDEAPLAYSFQYGNVYVAVMSYLLASDVEEAAEWLVEDASNATASWKILAMHQPTYFTNVGGGSSRAMMDVIASAVDEANIDVVFSGHDHSYARTYPITGGVQADGGAVYYICAATSAEKGYQVTSDPAIHAVATNEYNAIYLTVNATDTEMAITTWNFDGTNHNVFDEYTITKEITCTDKGHDYVLADGWLTCSVCGYTISVDGYTGLAKDPETDLLMNIVDGVAEASKWIEIEGKVYYLNENGVAVAGEQKIGDYTYSFDANGALTEFAFVLPDGTLASNQWFGNQYLGADGHFVTGEQTIDGKTYTFDDEGNFVKGALVKEGSYTYYYIANEKQRGWANIDGYWHYFDRQTGFGMATADNADKVATDLDRTDGKYTIKNTDETYLLFTFDKAGRLVGGAWSETENGTVYYWGNNERLTGWQYIEGDIYYFGADFYMVTGEQTIGEKAYTFGEDGKLQLKEENFELDGKFYYYDANGEIVDGHIADHAYAKTVIDAVDSDCTNTGLTAGEKCADCDFILTAQTEVAAKGHTAESVPGKAATCTETGITDGEKCSVCGTVTVAQEEISATGHDYVAVVTAPTCTEGGYTTYTCSVCNDSYVGDETAATGHTAGEWEVVTPAEIGVAGLEQRKCTVCGAVIDEKEIPAIEEPSSEEPSSDEETTVPPVVYGLGDVDKDGEITAADARIALRIAAKLEKVDNEIFALADVDGNGKITAFDARKILRVSAKLDRF